MVQPAAHVHQASALQEAKLGSGLSALAHVEGNIRQDGVKHARNYFTCSRDLQCRAHPGTRNPQLTVLGQAFVANERFGENRRERFETASLKI